MVKLSLNKNTTLAPPSQELLLPINTGFSFPSRAVRLRITLLTTGNHLTRISAKIRQSALRIFPSSRYFEMERNRSTGTTGTKNRINATNLIDSGRPGDEIERYSW
jgi:hypothetical protein